MKNLFKVLAAVAVMAGVCFAVYELFLRWDEHRRRQPNATLKSFIDHGLRRKKTEEDDDYFIADYRDEDDDFLFDDDFFADLDGSTSVEVEIEDAPAAAAVEDDEDDEPAVSFDLSEEALEQMLDS